MAAQTDLRQFLRKLNGEAKRRAMVAAARALAQAAQHVIGDSQDLCPVETGALQASGTTSGVDRSGDRLIVTIGHNVEYAAAVHERLNARHAQGQAKYLETAVRNNVDTVPRYVMNEIRKAL